MLGLQHQRKPAMSDRMPSSHTLPYLTPEHDMLRESLRRFIAQRVLPNADAWEEAGFVPREILREMGEMGWLGMRYDNAHGGSELDVLSTVVLAEELGRSGYGG